MRELYKEHLSKVLTTFDKLMQKIDKLEIVKKEISPDTTLEDREEVQYASGEESPNKRLELLDYIFE